MKTMTPGEMMVWAATYAQKFLERPVDVRRLAALGVPWSEMAIPEIAAVAAVEWAWSAVHELRQSSGEAVKKLFGDEAYIFLLQMTVMGHPEVARQDDKVERPRTIVRAAEDGPHFLLTRTEATSIAHDLEFQCPKYRDLTTQTFRKMRRWLDELEDDSPPSKA